MYIGKVGVFRMLNVIEKDEGYVNLGMFGEESNVKGRLLGSKIISRIGHRSQRAFWNTMLILEALGRAPRGRTPSQSGLRAGVVIL